MKITRAADAAQKAASTSSGSSFVKNAAGNTTQINTQKFFATDARHEPRTTNPRIGFKNGNVFYSLRKMRIELSPCPSGRLS